MMQATRPDGLLVLDKPPGMTSRAALDRAARWFQRGTRTGHTGTLDPAASGVLVLCLGSATRLAEYVQAMAKTYRSTFRLGARSTSDDADGTITVVDRATPPGSDTVALALAGLVGRIEQVPPAFSAAKVGGRRAYDLARRGRPVTLTPRQVDVYRIDTLLYDYPLLEVECHCGKGTYIRSLARDLGERLGCGAFVQTLRRTRVGPFAVEDAVTLDCDATVAGARVLPPEAAVAELPRAQVTLAEAERLQHGQAVAGPCDAMPESQVAVFDPTGRFCAVAKADATRRLLVPAKVIPRP
jgi:tRNA pseudouridine55 synthase